MKAMFVYLLSPKFVLTVAAFFALAGSTFAQDGPQRQNARRTQNNQRPDIARELGFSPEQVQEFTRLNQHHRPMMDEALKRMRDANRELDMAIYADVVSDGEVRTKLKAFQDAQIELNRLRFIHELNIRKILTPDQLVRFRELRRRFAESRQQIQRDDPGTQPARTPLRRRNQRQRNVDDQKRPVT